MDIFIELPGIKELFRVSPTLFIDLCTNSRHAGPVAPDRMTMGWTGNVVASGIPLAYYLPKDCRQSAFSVFAIPLYWLLGFWWTPRPQNGWSIYLFRDVVIPTTEPPTIVKCCESANLTVFIIKHANLITMRMWVGDWSWWMEAEVRALWHLTNITAIWRLRLLGKRKHESGV